MRILSDMNPMLIKIAHKSEIGQFVLRVMGGFFDLLWWRNLKRNLQNDIVNDVLNKNMLETCANLRPPIPMNAPSIMLGYRKEQQYEFLHNATQWRVFNDDGDDNNNNRS